MVVGVAGPLGAAPSQVLVAGAEDDVRVQLLHHAEAVDQVWVQLSLFPLAVHHLVHSCDIFRPSRDLLVADVQPLLLRLRLLGAVKNLHGHIGLRLGLGVEGFG